MRPFGIVILAAGGSTRLGRAKQLLPYKGHTLVEHVVSQALGADPLEVVVVVGAEAEPVRSVLVGLPVRTVLNANWESGMSSSILTGIESLSEAALAAVIIGCDQPSVTSRHFRLLAEKALGGRIAASIYNDVRGIPCSFPRSFFSALMGLTGDQGARALIRSEETALVPLDHGEFDVDTEAEARELL